MVIHVAPIPRDHEASPSCWCMPICGLDGGADTTTCVHRLSTSVGDPFLELMAPSRWAEQERRDGG